MCFYILSTFHKPFTIFSSKKMDLWLPWCVWICWHDSLHLHDLPSLWPPSAASLYLVSKVNSQRSALSHRPQTETAKPNPDLKLQQTPSPLAAVRFLLLCVKKVINFKQINTTLSPEETPKLFLHLNVWHIIEKVSQTHNTHKSLTKKLSSL